MLVLQEASFFLALASSVPMVIAGVTVLAGAGGGLYWAVVQVVLGLSIAIYLRLDPAHRDTPVSGSNIGYEHGKHGY